ncbi:MAG: class I SAM-dependent methyltransferase [Chloroflexi bacterium]|nr:class I SAM-dependent methyltransferase [Chloroflexota bacterium]
MAAPPAIDIGYEGVSTLEVLEAAVNYNRWIGDTLLRHLRAPALEIGAGTGNLTSQFADRLPVHATDADPGLVAALRQRFAGDERVSVGRLDVCQPAPDELRGRFASTVAVNVLEHIEDEQAALTTMADVLAPGGSLVLLVPAKKFAYSRLDAALGHCRRYERGELVDTLQGAGFSVHRVHFFNIVGLLSWWLRDKLDRQQLMRPSQVALFDHICPTLQFLEGLVRPPLGVSLIAVASRA